MNEYNEERIIALATAGDNAAFDKLIDPYLKPLYNICLSMLSSQEDAEDAAQDAVIKAYKSLGSFRGGSKFSTWLYRIAINSVKDLLKKKQRAEVLSLEEQVELSGDSILEARARLEKNPEQKLEQKELRKQIQNAILALPQNARELIVLRELRGQSYEEIAEILGKNVGSVKSGLSRARAQLASLLLERGIVPSSYERRGF